MEDRPEPLILFDGMCNLCSGVVQFTAKRDNGEFQFAPLQSEVAEEVLSDTYIDPRELETFVLIENGEVYTESRAALKLLEALGGKWKVLSRILGLVPGPVRDLGYRLVAKSRHRVFGMKDSCMVPEGDLSDRFVSQRS